MSEPFKFLKFEDDAIVLQYGRHSVRVYPIGARWLVVVRTARNGRIAEALPLDRLTDVEGFVQLVIDRYEDHEPEGATEVELADKLFPDDLCPITKKGLINCEEADFSDGAICNKCGKTLF